MLVEAVPVIHIPSHGVFLRRGTALWCSHRIFRNLSEMERTMEKWGARGSAYGWFGNVETDFTFATHGIEQIDKLLIDVVNHSIDLRQPTAFARVSGDLTVLDLRFEIVNASFDLNEISFLLLIHTNDLTGARREQHIDEASGSLTSSLIDPWQLSWALRFIISDSTSARLVGKPANFVCSSGRILSDRTVSSDEIDLFNDLAIFWTTVRMIASLASKRFFAWVVCS